jgi:Raf kinase inhibitor-like YbhB/YbcL family protein
MVAEAEHAETDAVIGMCVRYDSIWIGQGGSMLIVSASGKAVKL